MPIDRKVFPHKEVRHLFSCSEGEPIIVVSPQDHPPRLKLLEERIKILRRVENPVGTVPNLVPTG